MPKAKKAIAFMMAAAMAASVPITAFADDPQPTEVTTNGGKGTTEINYTPPVKYTVTIPAKVTLKENQAVEETITVSDVTIEPTKKITVSISSDSSLTVSNGSATSLDTLSYTIKIGNVSKNNGDDLFSVVSTDITSATPTVTKKLTFSSPTTPKYADTYTGQLTFNVSYTGASS